MENFVVGLYFEVILKVFPVVVDYVCNRFEVNQKQLIRMNDDQEDFEDKKEILHFEWILQHLINHDRYKHEEVMNDLIYVLNDLLHQDDHSIEVR